jgi:hypothetical protein
MPPKGNIYKPKSFEESFASHPKSMYWNYEKNDNMKPEDIRKSSDKKFWFKCDKCPHEFQKSLSKITLNSWCPYCSRTKKILCEDENCKICIEKSFQSHPRSQYWNYEKNGNVKPRQSCLNSAQKYWFECDKCSHSFQSSLSNITTLNQWCPYCSNQKLCENDNCKECIEKSFQSHPRSQYWNYEKNEKITPRQVFKGSSASSF